MEKRTYNTTEKRIWEISDLWGAILYGLVIILEIVVICSLAILFFSQPATKPSDFPDLSHERNIFVVETGEYLNKEEYYSFSKKMEKKSEIGVLIIEEAQKAGIAGSVAWDIAFCESGLDPLAENKASSAKGLFQFTEKTWLNYCDGYVFNAEDNLRCFLKLYPYKKDWWVCKG